YPSRDGLAVHAARVDYAPGGFSRVHRHPAGAYVYVMEGSVLFGVGGREPVRLSAGDSFYEPPGALHSLSRYASEEEGASLMGVSVPEDGELPSVGAGGCASSVSRPPGSSGSRRRIDRRPARARRWSACTRRRSPVASWTGRSSGCRRSPLMSCRAWS